MYCRTAVTLRPFFIGKVSRNSVTVSPLRRFWNRLDTVTRPWSKHHAPLILLGFRQSPGHAFQSIRPGASLLFGAVFVVIGFPFWRLCQCNTLVVLAAW